MTTACPEPFFDDFSLCRPSCSEYEQATFFEGMHLHSRKNKISTQISPNLVVPSVRRERVLGRGLVSSGCRRRQERFFEISGEIKQRTTNYVDDFTKDYNYGSNAVSTHSIVVPVELRLSIFAHVMVFPLVLVDECLVERDISSSQIFTSASVDPV
jgi:hypothetical protein